MTEFIFPDKKTGEPIILILPEKVTRAMVKHFDKFMLDLDSTDFDGDIATKTITQGENLQEFMEKVVFRKQPAYKVDFDEVPFDDLYEVLSVFF